MPKGLTDGIQCLPWREELYLLAVAWSEVDYPLARRSALAAWILASVALAAAIFRADFEAPPLAPN